MNAYNELLKGIKYVLDNCTAYRVSKDLNINARTINRYQNGTSPIGNMSLETAGKIYDYYIKNKERLKMMEIVNEIRKKYRVDGEDERYVEYYETEEEIIEQFGDIERFEEVTEIDFESVVLPILYFDRAGSGADYLFDANSDVEDILKAAEDYFNRK